MPVHLVGQIGPENLFTAEKLTLVGVLVTVIWAIMTRRLVPGQFYEDLKRENDELRRALDKWRDTGRDVAGVAEELARTTRRESRVPRDRHKDNPS
jgi:hypothetical protein